MRTDLRVCVLILACIAAGCSTSREQELLFISKELELQPEIPAATVTPGFDSPEAVTGLLEQRWSLADIKRFCIPERRANPFMQNLVRQAQEIWEGKLYSGQQSGFDEISWYANVREGRVEKYSLNVQRGEDYWNLEIASPERTQRPPDVEPDPSYPGFIERE